MASNIFITMYFSMDLFRFILLGNFWVLIMDVQINVFHQIWEISDNYFFKYCFWPSLSLSLPLSHSPSISLPPPWNSCYAYVDIFYVPMLIFFMFLCWYFWCFWYFWHWYFWRWNFWQPSDTLLLEAYIHSVFSANWIILTYLQVHWFFFFCHLKLAVEP